MKPAPGRKQGNWDLQSCVTTFLSQQVTLWLCLSASCSQTLRWALAFLWVMVKNSLKKKINTFVCWNKEALNPHICTGETVRGVFLCVCPLWHLYQILSDLSSLVSLFLCIPLSYAPVTWECFCLWWCGLLALVGCRNSKPGECKGNPSSLILLQLQKVRVCLHFYLTSFQDQILGIILDLVAEGVFLLVRSQL